MIINMVAGEKKPSGTRNISQNGTYDVTDYAYANVNVPDAVDTPVLLWSNTNTGGFDPQTVNVNGANYEAYLVEVRTASGTDAANYQRGIGLIKKDYPYVQYVGVTKDRSGSTAASQPYARSVMSATDTAIKFGNGYATGVSNTAAVPTRIWGVKFTL